eukprot:1719852-Alexandrium_andersonii.AAC.1
MSASLVGSEMCIRDSTLHEGSSLCACIYVSPELFKCTWGFASGCHTALSLGILGRAVVRLHSR